MARAPQENPSTGSPRFWRYLGTISTTLDLADWAGGPGNGLVARGLIILAAGTSQTLQLSDLADNTFSFPTDQLVGVQIAGQFWKIHPRATATNGASVIIQW